ncbi:ABC transporter ATP-binding protein [Candidatus Kaiserbacteria bacterium]|nr:ABC transporter ATP-binding protein [Candidatus Kaiserbacteria bacterium]
MPVLEVKNLSKIYGGVRAVDDVSFSVGKGEVVGLLGPNGAGKTTTIHMLLGITKENGGAVRYFGRDFSKHRVESLQRINAASAFNTLLGRITVVENLLVFAKLYLVKDARRKIATLLDRFEMAEYARSIYWSLSSGQRTRVNLVKALLNDPEILLMDEPTASLDPDIADKTLSLIEELRRERGLSILYTSHNMQEITRICDRVIFLDHGKIVAHDTPENLRKRITRATVRLVFSGGGDAIERYVRDRGLSYTLLNDAIEIATEEPDIPELLFGASHLGGAIIDIEIRKPTLEDVFLQIARKEL